MLTLLNSLGFGLAVAFMLIGALGVIIPIVPGTLLTWIAVLAYAWVTDFAIITPGMFAILTVIALVTGTADLWLPLLGAKKTGASRRAIALGVVGGIAGTFVIPLLGTVIGYAVGVLLGEYLKHRDLPLAWRASLGGVAGWGVATAVQLGGALLMTLMFVLRVLFA